MKKGKCPKCNSQRIHIKGTELRCKRCGYVHKSNKKVNENLSKKRNWDNY